MQTQQGQTDTVLPRAIRRQMARVNEKLEARASAATSAPPPQATEGAAAVTDGDPGTAAPAPTQAPAAPAPAPAAADPRENDPTYWKARFKVTEGMLRRAQEDLRQAQADADQTIQELRNQLAELQAASTSPKGSLDVSAFFTKEQIEQFGPEQCEAMAQAAIKAARTQADEIIRTAVEPLKKDRDTQQRQQQRIREDTFWSELAEATPDYEDINADPKWRAWLAEVDDATGLVRQDILDKHRASLNARGVSALFEKFRALQNAGKATAEPPVAPPRSGGENNGAGDRGAATGGRGYPTPDEIRDYHKRAATIRNPRDPRFVTDKERKEFEARLQLPKPGA